MFSWGEVYDTPSMGWRIPLSVIRIKIFIVHRLLYTDPYVYVYVYSWDLWSADMIWKNSKVNFCILCYILKWALKIANESWVHKQQS